MIFGLEISNFLFHFTLNVFDEANQNNCCCSCVHSNRKYGQVIEKLITVFPSSVSERIFWSVWKMTNKCMARGGAVLGTCVLSTQKNG